MDSETSAATATYEDRYRSLGLLFHSIAGCDRRIIQAEIDALKRMVQEHWLAADGSYDDLGIESARYIDVAFDQAREQTLPSKEAYSRFEREQLADPGRYNGWTRSLILRTAMAIAEASGSVNREEAALIRKLEKLLTRTA